MSKPLKLGVIGPGKIAEFHVPAAREAGFEVTAVAARKGSTSVLPFAQRHGIPQTFDGVEALLEARHTWDALLIAASTAGLLELLRLGVELDVPILIEKPVAMNSRELAPFVTRELPVMVAYNRRFYPGVQAAREEVSAGAPVMGSLTMPEAIRNWGGPGTSCEPLLFHFANSVHGLDLLRFIFGDLTVTHRELLPPAGAGVPGFAALLRTKRGDVVQVLANWGAPANMAISIDRPGRRLELRPYEHLTVYEGMRVVDPTPDIPIRTYRPLVVREVPLARCDIDFKPGFVGQMRAFADLCRGGTGGLGARLSDAKAVLELAESVVGVTYSTTPAEIPQ